MKLIHNRLRVLLGYEVKNIDRVDHTRLYKMYYKSNINYKTSEDMWKDMIVNNIERD